MLQKDLGEKRARPMGTQMGAGKPLQGGCSSHIGCALLFPSSVAACFGGRVIESQGSCSQREPEGRAVGATPLAPALAAPGERLTADLGGGVLGDHGVGGELGVQDAAMSVGVHGQRVQQLAVLQHPRVQQAARLGDQLGHVL